jgi:hypothetical protein
MTVSLPSRIESKVSPFTTWEAKACTEPLGQAPPGQPLRRRLHCLRLLPVTLDCAERQAAQGPVETSHACTLPIDPWRRRTSPP